MQRATLVLLSAAVLAALANAQPQINPQGNYPQFRSMSGLPGSGFGVTREGLIDFRGAMAHSTPVAFSLTDWQFVIGINNLSYDSSLRFRPPTSIDDSRSRSNGTVQMMLGIPLGPYGNVTFSNMIVSRLLDNAQNLHWTPPGQTGPVVWGLGVQDIGGQRGTSGEIRETLPDGTVRVTALGESRSYYFVGTYQAAPGTFVSLGSGDGRFWPIHGNVSTQVGDRFKLVLEYDSFNWNYGLAADLGQLSGDILPGRPLRATLMVGQIFGDLAYWSLNFHF